MTVENITVDKEPEVTTIAVIPDETVALDKGCYHGVYEIKHFTKEDGVNSKEYQVEIDPYTYK